jgi:hypothetical protein
VCPVEYLGGEGCSVGCPGGQGYLSGCREQVVCPKERRGGKKSRIWGSATVTGGPVAAGWQLGGFKEQIVCLIGVPGVSKEPKEQANFVEFRELAEHPVGSSEGSPSAVSSANNFQLQLSSGWGLSPLMLSPI